VRCLPAAAAAAAVATTPQMFIRAKKAPRCPWQVFVASALMEWRHAREKDVARKIFEKGLEVAEFATVPEYVLAYAGFLCGESLVAFSVCVSVCAVQHRTLECCGVL
jgi:hypothetical protein